jgi:hypothetical protein
VEEASFYISSLMPGQSPGKLGQRHTGETKPRGTALTSENKAIVTETSKWSQGPSHITISQYHNIKFISSFQPHIFVALFHAASHAIEGMLPEFHYI